MAFTWGGWGDEFRWWVNFVLFLSPAKEWLQRLLPFLWPPSDINAALDRISKMETRHRQREAIFARGKPNSVRGKPILVKPKRTPCSSLGN
ncbi:hypothetical protein BDW59DRAFT_148125 [Aspergillus cavernicola]|uniref:Uncharacterized protein n=1 Tax=Aspergillus cavernicola TaxID=176166 RepID=A0ABR4I801_9EURO